MLAHNMLYIIILTLLTIRVDDHTALDTGSSYIDCLQV